MLIIFDAIPIPTPSPTVAFEKTDDGVAFGHDCFISEGMGTVFASFEPVFERFFVGDATAAGDVGIFDGVDVDRFAVAVA